MITRLSADALTADELCNGVPGELPFSFDIYKRYFDI
jgi:hypothetical protein